MKLGLRVPWQKTEDEFVMGVIGPLSRSQNTIIENL